MNSPILDKYNYLLDKLDNLIYTDIRLSNGAKMNTIKLIRLRKGMTQSEIAEKLNVTQAVISGWENNRYMPSVKNAFELARVLDCTIDELYEKKQQP